MRRALALAALTLLLASCGSEIPLRIGPLRLVAGLSLLEVRVWAGPECPPDARAAVAPATAETVSVQEFYTGTEGAGPVGAVPAGVHAVSVVARGPDCTVLLYGCTPNIDFASASAVTVTWDEVPAGITCDAGDLCDLGACFEPRADAGP